MRVKKTKSKLAAQTARYRVKAEIEHNGVLYCPAQALTPDGTGNFAVKPWEQRTATARASVRKDRKGQEQEYERYQVPVDKSGFIRLTEAEAAAMFAQGRRCPIALAEEGEVIPRQDPGYPVSPKGIDTSTPVVPHYQHFNVENPAAPHARPVKPIVGNINETAI
jgi:hypothetical protein